MCVIKAREVVEDSQCERKKEHCWQEPSRALRNSPEAVQTHVTAPAGPHGPHLLNSLGSTAYVGAGSHNAAECRHGISMSRDQLYLL